MPGRGAHGLDSPPECSWRVSSLSTVPDAHDHAKSLQLIVPGGLLQHSAQRLRHAGPKLSSRKVGRQVQPGGSLQGLT